MNANMVTISCPEFRQTIDLDVNLKIGQQAACQFCHTDFMGTWLFPICLDYLETEEQIYCLPKTGSTILQSAGLVIVK